MPSRSQPLHEMMNVSPALFMAALVVLSIISLVLAVFFVVVFCKLFHKMGHHWALGFLSLLPFGSSLILAYMAFSRWPVQDEHRLLLHAWAGLTYEQTAAALGVPIGTVRSRLNRVRRRLAPAGSQAAARLTWMAKVEG